MNVKVSSGFVILNLGKGNKILYVVKAKVSAVSDQVMLSSTSTQVLGPHSRFEYCTVGYFCLHRISLSNSLQSFKKNNGAVILIDG